MQQSSSPSSHPPGPELDQRLLLADACSVACRKQLRSISQWTHVFLMEKGDFRGC